MLSALAVGFLLVDVRAANVGLPVPGVSSKDIVNLQS